MAIYRYNGQKLLPGMIVCPVSSLTAGLCGTPREVVRTTAQSVVLRDTRNLDQTTKRLDNIAFVCDTEADGWRAFDASVELVAKEQRIDQQQRAGQAERKRAAIAVLEG